MAGKGNKSDEMEEANYNKLEPQKAGPFHIIKEQPHTVLLNKEGATNAVLTCRVTVASGLREQRSETAQMLSSPKDESHKRKHQRKTEKTSVGVTNVSTLGPNTQ